MKLKPIKYTWLIVGLSLVSLVLFGAELKLHPAFSDNMVLQRDQPNTVFGFGQPGTVVTVEFAGQSTTATVGSDGKWQTLLAPLKASASPSVLSVNAGADRIVCTNILVGDVWFCGGQSNMERPFKVFSQLKDKVATLGNPQIRLYTTAHVTSAKPLDVPLAPTRKTEQECNRWQECNAKTLLDFSPIAYYFGAKVNATLNVPVGLLVSAWGSTAAEPWVPSEVLATLKLGYQLPYSPNGNAQQNQPGLCYNSMIHPFQQLAFKGFIWYQGESNSRWPDKYKILFPALINYWRESFHAENRPFYFVQVAPHMTLPWDISGEAWAWLRDSQTATLQLAPKTGMTVITDLGEYEDIHPQSKQAAGERLALFALRDAGLSVQPQSPMFKSMKIEGHRCEIKFANAEAGLETRRVAMNKQKDQPIQQDPQAAVVLADKLKGFTICGDDHKFLPAQAAIAGDHVAVWNDTIPAPVAVRYGWANFPLCNLFSKEGLPVCPFRTDDFPMPVLSVEKK
jgi:sialate O-acetylesterase